MVAAASASPHRVILRVVDAGKSYGGVRALASATLDVRAGEVHALVGENGAGKSTLIKLLTGAVAPDAGRIEVDGVRVTLSSPREARRLGIAAIYQQPALFPELSVAENLALGTEHARAWRVDWRARHARAATLLARVGARIDPAAEAGALSMPEQQLVEIARALGASPRLLILDEPTASLPEADAQRLLAIMRALRSEGVGMIHISHRLDEVAAVADRVTVLRDGVTLGTHASADVSRAQLIQLMVGRDVAQEYPKRAVTVGEPLLDLREVGNGGAGVRDVSLQVRAGEILGVAGLVGSGRTELARVLFGITPADSGEITVRGRRVTLASPADAIRAGVAYVPEDRKRHGVIGDMAVAANVTLASLPSLARRNGALDTVREDAAASDFVQRLGVKTPSVDTPVGALSGGNQQKVALSRWLMTRPTVLVLDEPTQGVDVGAKAEIHALIGALAAEGVAIIMISSELPEVLGMSDRVAVMRGGTVVSVLTREEATPERVMALAFAG